LLIWNAAPLTLPFAVFSKCTLDGMRQSTSLAKASYQDMCIFPPGMCFFWQDGHQAILELAQQKELRAFLSSCGLPPSTLQRLSAAADLRRREARCACHSYPVHLSCLPYCGSDWITLAIALCHT
jgi:hypothetical protein